jgi:hypothetical protein
MRTTLMGTNLWRPVMKQLRAHVGRTRNRLRLSEHRSQGHEQRYGNLQLHKQPFCRLIHTTHRTWVRIQISADSYPISLFQGIQLSRNKVSIGEHRRLVTLIRRPGTQFPTSKASLQAFPIPSCNSLAIKAYWSTVASMRLLSGIPAPCPALVSTRIRIGFGPA